MSDRRIEYGSGNPLESENYIELTDELRRFLELKYASVLLGSSSPKESLEVKKALESAFTETEAQELENLSQIFAKRGWTYATLASVVDKNYHGVLSGIQKKIVEKRNNILQEANIFNN